MQDRLLPKKLDTTCVRGSNHSLLLLIVYTTHVTPLLFSSYKHSMSESSDVVQDQKKNGLGLAHCGLDLGLAVLVLLCETRSCNVRRHNNDLEEHCTATS